MDTPICDFIRWYAESNTLRMHMPGHKGVGPLGCEILDITEISGADCLYEAQGIIAQSEKNASALFGCPTFYSTEGSSQCIRAMLHLATCGKNRKVAAGRNVHKAFLSAAALLDLQVDWLYPEEDEGYLSCRITADTLEEYLSNCVEIPAAVYLTSPDYLGNLLDIEGLAFICHRYDVRLLVDNAHGAYLKFLPTSLHPMDLGADLCCDSAHKTLPVLTGGAYLHVRDENAVRQAKDALSLFGSTSPSYLILQSLDAVNRYLADGYRETLAEFVRTVDASKARLSAFDYCFAGSEPMKLTIRAKHSGFTGIELARHLQKKGLECEFADPDYVVLMPSPGSDLNALEDALICLEHRSALDAPPPALSFPKRVLSIREALLSPAETVPVAESEGRILAAASVGCPPAVPIVVCGERIDRSAIRHFEYYGIKNCSVIL